MGSERLILAARSVENDEVLCVAILDYGKTIAEVWPVAYASPGPILHFPTRTAKELRVPDFTRPNFKRLKIWSWCSSPTLSQAYATESLRETTYLVWLDGEIAKIDSTIVKQPTQRCCIDRQCQP